MAIDLIGIVEHKLTKKEILNLPKLLIQWNELRSCFLEFNQDSIGENLDLEINWEEEISEELLEKVWEYREARGTKQFPILMTTNYLNCFFGDLKINRHTIIISLNEHKYANVYNPKIANFTIELNRKIAKNLGAEQVLYCVDSGYPTASIYHESMAGLRYTELIDFAKTEFGDIPKNLEEGINNYCFIDQIRT